MPGGSYTVLGKKKTDPPPAEEREAAGAAVMEEGEVPEISDAEQQRALERMEAAETFRDFMRAGGSGDEVDVKITRRGPKKYVSRAGKLVTVDVGYCDTVPLEILRPVPEETIAQLWGGGVYTVQGLFEGQSLRGYTLKVGGNPLPIERGEVETAEEAKPAQLDPLAQLEKLAGVMAILQGGRPDRDPVDEIRRLRELDEEFRPAPSAAAPAGDDVDDELDKVMAKGEKSEEDEKLDGWVRFAQVCLEGLKVLTGETPTTPEAAVNKMLTDYMNAKITTEELAKTLRKYAKGDELEAISCLDPKKAPALLARKYKLSDEVKDYFEGAAGQRKLRDLQKALES